MVSYQEDINEYVRTQIRAAREIAGLSQEELGKAIGKSNANISDIERGRLNVSFADLVVIAKTLNQPLSYFVPRKYLPAVQRYDLLERDLQVAKLFSQLTYPALEKAILDLLQTLVAFANDHKSD